MNNKIYIAGKMTGDADYKVKFRLAESNLNIAMRRCAVNKCCRDCRFYSRDYVYGCRIYDLFPSKIEIVNPIDFNLEGKSRFVTMLICLHRLRQCSYVYMLADWRESRGARKEHWLAKLLKKRIIYERQENQ